MKGLVKSLALITVGGLLYILIELLYRQYTHWTMFLVGGIAFFLIGIINELFSWGLSIWKQAIIGAILVTIVEFISGVFINIVFDLGVWDYSNLPFNILGQVCLLFTIFWFFLSIVGILLDDFLRWKLFKEEKPRYNFRWSSKPQRKE